MKPHPHHKRKDHQPRVLDVIHLNVACEVKLIQRGLLISCERDSTAKTASQSQCCGWILGCLMTLYRLHLLLSVLMSMQVPGPQNPPGHSPEDSPYLSSSTYPSDYLD